MRYEITAMDERHLDDCAKIESRCFSDPWSRGMLEEEIKNDFSLYLAAENAEGHVVGYAGAHIAADEASINNVATSPDYRRQGIAEAVLRELTRTAEQRGARKFSLEVRCGNAPAIALYTKLGFHTAGVRKRYYMHPQEDALIMIKEI